MGQMFRSYWLPALLAEELPDNDCPPVRVKLMSERLVAFRDSQGRYGLIDEFCAHRGVSLWFGRNEEGGLRCPYHGWKYDVTGQCIEVPSEPVESGFCNKVKLASYPLIKLGEVLWTYMGPAGQKAAAAGMGIRHGAAGAELHLQAAAGIQLAAGHGGRHRFKPCLLPASRRSSVPIRCSRAPRATSTISSDMQPHFEVVEQPGGLFIGARRNAENGNYYWRITPWVMPCFTMIPPRGDHPIHGHFWVPIDDETCWAWSYDFHPVRALTKVEVEAMKNGAGVHCKYIPGTYRPLANKDNDYLIDRAGQKAGKTFSGVAGFAMQDASLQESMGPICDRTKENLVSTDNGIIMARHRLMRAAKALAEKGTIPPGIDPEHHKIRSCSVVLPPDVAFKDGAKEALKARPGMAQTTV